MSQSAFAATVMQIHLAVMARAGRPRAVQCNAYPPGMVVGCCTWTVWRELLKAHPAVLTHSTIIRRTGLGRGAVAWALRYLHDHGVVAKLPHPHHSQYCQYQALL
jgi:hypothetical protein